jgi:hypothetical protein
MSASIERAALGVTEIIGTEGNEVSLGIDDKYVASA